MTDEALVSSRVKCTHSGLVEACLTDFPKLGPVTWLQFETFSVFYKKFAIGYNL